MDPVREGKITVAPEVLLDIVHQAVLYAEGVVGMASIPPRVDRIFRKLVSADGVEMEIGTSSITIDLYLVVQPVDLLALSHRVQKEVIRSLDKLVGLTVDAVNVHIEDVAYSDNGSN